MFAFCWVPQSVCTNFLFSLFSSALFYPHLPPFYKINGLSLYCKGQGYLTNTPSSGFPPSQNSSTLLLPPSVSPSRCCFSWIFWSVVRHVVHCTTGPPWALLFCPQVTHSPVPRISFLQSPSLIHHRFFTPGLSLSSFSFVCWWWNDLYYRIHSNLCPHKQNTLSLPLETQLCRFLWFHCETFPSGTSHLCVLSLFLYRLIPFQTHCKSPLAPKLLHKCSELRFWLIT